MSSQAQDFRASMIAQQTAAQRTVITPEGVPVRVELAERSERLGATLLDLVFIQLLLALFILSLVLMAWATGWALSQFFAILYFLGNFLLLNFYFVYFELRWNGQTPGKRITKIRVIDARGGPLTGRAVMARNVLRNLELFLPITVLGGGGNDPLQAWQQIFIWVWLGAMLSLPFINRDRMRGGDLVAGTWVITAPKAELLGDMASDSTTASHGFTREQLSTYGVYELQTLESVLREARPEVMMEVAQRIATRIRHDEPISNAERFLQAFYAALRTQLESGLLMGRRKADKFDIRR